MAIISKYPLKVMEEVAPFPPIQNTANPYLTEAAMHADQANQLEGYGYLVTDVGAFTYLGTLAGTAADYEPFGGGVDFKRKVINFTEGDSQIFTLDNAFVEVLAVELRTTTLAPSQYTELPPTQIQITDTIQGDGTIVIKYFVSIGSVASKTSKFLDVDSIEYGDVSDKIPEFRKNWINKEKDLVVVSTGTSLTSSELHSTEYIDKSERPPLMAVKNLASHIWDKIKWSGQFYRRYDNVGFFNELGIWTFSDNLAEWDDNSPARTGETRYSDDVSSNFKFEIPVNAWQFNLIYRTDSLGTENAAISITEGNGKVEVFNGTSWVEANGFIFSQKEAPVTILPSVTYLNPVTKVDSTLTDYQVKGNTTFQKRLKMRCKSGAINSLATAKNVTISRTSGRLMYWGVEWSERQFMITYINAARGSHSGTVNSSLSLMHFQDNEVWGFKPDLILSENPIHNSGAGSSPNSGYPTSYWAQTTEGYFFEANGVSMQDRALTLGITGLEFVIFNSSMGQNGGAINTDGTLESVENADGLMINALDAQMRCYDYLKANYPNLISLNAAKVWVEASRAMYPDLYKATLPSDKSGTTLLDDGTHWNDLGAKVIARVVLPVFNFTI